ncbi:NADPH-dependent 7-cyano-7-deazaguanine reductase QueF [Pandoraea anapnoica]|uniref:NADPH-dependent 7-cyano-7-deazaguanine reductase n=1 Tax=Pandoraea anapnoica TaxID=2508301 RepID=A0A5E4ZMD6_9BURK|nr:NADPH-dependent 7-cyano-7-deazaguanine reductase QueF [Pandoraea anapnoica]VVE61572.1 NADPH-dependent 7-cyano-7-deazaguanine reductase QueF [Pandoraea anapnoica]
MTTPEQSSLGKEVAYTEQYDPSQLFPIARAPARAEIGVPDALPFFGADIWNGYELSWLNEKGKPQIALLTAMVPADSPFIIESKSFKLYLGSFAQTKLANVDAARALIQQDLSEAAGAPVQVRLVEPSGFGKLELDELDGLLVDRLDIDTDIYVPDASLLTAAFDEAPVDETLVSNLLKSNCPVTGQPDWGSLQIRYVGPPINQEGLLKYVISYRRHTGFHEQCVEGIFMDIMRQCKPTQLAVYARYTRRGGLDINPFRTNFTLPMPDNARTARQ